MNRKALFLDVDMTMLDNAGHLPAKNKKAIEAALEAGHIVCINTGRPIAGALCFEDMFDYKGPGLYIIGFNGGVIYDCYEKKVVASEDCDPESVKRVLTIAKGCGMHVQTYDDEHILTYQPWDKEIELYTSRVKVPVQQIFDLKELDGRKLRKAVVIDLNDTKHLTDFRKAHSEEIGNKLEPVLSTPYFLEYIKQGVSKGSGIKMLCGLTGMDVKDTIAAGDEENDISMIKAAGVGCAVANARPAVKAVADYICKCDNNESAVAEIIEKFLEIRVDE